MTKLAIPILAVAALAVAGCGSSSSSGSSSGSGSRYPTPAAGGATAPASASGSTVDVTMKNISFSPKTIHVKVGQTIKWTNEDNVDHNVTAGTGASFASKDFGNGQSYTFTPTKAGTITYSCTIHPGMDATIDVTQ